MMNSNTTVVFHEDFSLKLGDSIQTISFHPSLNVFVVTTKNQELCVYDSHSAVKLTEVDFSQTQGQSLTAKYHSGSNSILVLGGDGTFGQRRSYHGVLLLHSVLQRPVSSLDEIVTLDLLHSEAVLLQKALDLLSVSRLNCNPGMIENVTSVKECVKAALASHAGPGGAASVTAAAASTRNTNTAVHRARKWQCVQLRMPANTLRSVCSYIAAELRAGTSFSQALALSAALTHRLNALFLHLSSTGGSAGSQLAHHLAAHGEGVPLSSIDSHPGDPVESEPMCSEAARLATFAKWPHMNYKWALPAQMAEAGFFHQPLMPDDDRAMCFICSVCLVFWEPTDEPWSEHERHSPNCAFVKGEYTHNVPLSYTLSTSPAGLHHSTRPLPSTLKPLKPPSATPTGSSKDLTGPKTSTSTTLPAQPELQQSKLPDLLNLLKKEDPGLKRADDSVGNQISSEQCASTSDGNSSHNKAQVSSISDAALEDMSLSSGNSVDFIATLSRESGTVVLWKLCGQLQRVLSFSVEASVASVAERDRIPMEATPPAACCHGASPPREAWTDQSFESPSSSASLDTSGDVAAAAPTPVTPDHWEDSEALTPTNFSPPSSPYFSSPDILADPLHSAEPAAAPEKTPLSISASEGEVVPHSEASVGAPAAVSTVDCEVANACSSVVETTVEMKSSEPASAIPACVQSDSNADLNNGFQPNTKAWEASTPKKSSGTEQLLFEEVPSAPSEEACKNLSPVSVLSSTVLVDPAEAAFFGRGGVVGDLSSAPADEGLTELLAEQVARPCLVVAARMCRNQVLRDPRMPPVKTVVPAVKYSDARGNDTPVGNAAPSETSVATTLKNAGVNSCSVPPACDAPVEVGQSGKSEEPKSTNSTNDSNNVEGTSKKCPIYPYLLVYDFHLDSQLRSVSNKLTNRNSGTGQSPSSPGKGSNNSGKAGSSSKTGSGSPSFFDEMTRLKKIKSVSSSSKKWNHSLPSFYNESSAKDKSCAASDGAKDSCENKVIQPVCVQCILMPKMFSNPIVTAMLPTTCGFNLVLCLAESPTSSTSELNSTADPSSYKCRYMRLLVNGRASSADGSVVTLNDVESFSAERSSNDVIKDIIALPASACDKECSSEWCYCLFAAIKRDGSMCVFDTTYFLPLYNLAPHPSSIPNNSFCALTYCHILGIERVCVCLSDGTVQLVNFSRPGDTDSSSADETDKLLAHAAAAGQAMVVDDGGCSSKKSSTTDGEPLWADLAPSEETLLKCLQLTQFKPGCPNMVATVPPCWMEMTQAQQQRRNPQHLQQPQHMLHASPESTRCWSLDSDSCSWDEHLFELIITPSAASSAPNVSSSISVGHLNIKLQLSRQRQRLDPQIQVTLLRQTHSTSRGGGSTSKCSKESSSAASRRWPMAESSHPDSASRSKRKLNDPHVAAKGTSKAAKTASKTQRCSSDAAAAAAAKTNLPDGSKDASDSLDAAVAAMFDEAHLLDQLLDGPLNPATTAVFQAAHNAELVCGPVNVGDCLDLTGHTALVTFACPALLLHRGRCTFLIHIKAMPPQPQPAEIDRSPGVPDIMRGYSPPEEHPSVEKYMSSMDRGASASISNNSSDSLTGCNVIQELSITLSSAPCSLSDRRQRAAMVSKTSFHRQLVTCATAERSSVQLRHSALDLLLWLLTLHAPDRRANSKQPGSEEYVALVAAVQHNVEALVRHCLVFADRSLARKTTKLLVTIVQQDTVSSKRKGSFDVYDEREKVSSAVCKAVLACVPVVAAAHSAGALAHFFLLLNFVKWADQNATAAKVTELLNLTNSALKAKEDPLHLILQTHFGLHGNPLHRTLFDVLPPCFTDAQKAKSASDKAGDGGGGTAAASGGSNAYGNKAPKPGLLSSIGVSEIDAILFGPSEANSAAGPNQGSSSSSSNTTSNNANTTNNNNNNNAGSSANSGPGSGNNSNNNSSNIGSNGSGWSPLCPPLPGVCGLLEVEPLHVTLHTASDGTKLHRGGSGWGDINTAVGPTEDASDFINDDFSEQNGDFIITLAEQTAEHLAENVDDMMDLVLNLELERCKKGHTSELKKLLEGFHKPGDSSLDSLDLTMDSDLADIDALIGKTSEQIVKLQELVTTGSEMPHSSLPEQASLLNSVKNTAAKMQLLNLAYNGTSDLPPSQLLAAFEDADLSSPTKIYDLSLKELKFTKSSADDKNVKTNSGASSSAIDFVSKPDQGSCSSTSSKPSAQSQNLGTSSDCAASGGSLSPSCWQQFLSLPAQQYLVVERMYSGARRFVVFDFGEPVLLTDVFVPVCSDLVSLSVDVWLTGEERDAHRLVICSDIGSRPLVLSDIQPPPLCRFIKLTSLGRYGMVTGESTISLGNFYGHRLLLPWVPRTNTLTTKDPFGPASRRQAQLQLSAAASVTEAVGCRYTEASCRLRRLLLLYEQHCRLWGDRRDSLGCPTIRDQGLLAKIKAAYQDCMLEQHHLNVMMALLTRLQRVLGVAGGGRNVQDCSNTSLLLHQSPCDKLHALQQLCINSLLSLTLHPTAGALHPSSLSKVLLSYCGSATARSLFRSVMVRGPVAAQVSFAAMLLRTCAATPWWGEFLTSALHDLFASDAHRLLRLPAVRMFGLLTVMGQRSVCSNRGGTVINAALQSLARLLQPAAQTSHETDAVDTESSTASAAACSDDKKARYDALFARVAQPVSSGGQGEVACVTSPELEWLLLYLSHCLDAFPYAKRKDEKNADTGGRWSWLCAESWLTGDVWGARRCPTTKRHRKWLCQASSKSMLAAASARTFANKTAAAKAVGDKSSNKAATGLSSKVQLKKENLKLLQNKQLGQRAQAARATDPSRAFVISDPKLELDCPVAVEAPVPPHLDRSTALTVVRSLLALLTHYTSGQHDTFSVICKVVGVVCSSVRPCLSLREVFSEAQLLSLLLQQCCSPHNPALPWTLHAIVCLLTDVFYGEKQFGSVLPREEAVRSFTLRDGDSWSYVTDRPRHHSGKKSKSTPKIAKWAVDECLGEASDSGDTLVSSSEEPLLSRCKGGDGNDSSCHVEDEGDTVDSSSESGCDPRDSEDGGGKTGDLLASSDDEERDSSTQAPADENQIAYGPLEDDCSDKENTPPTVGLETASALSGSPAVADQFVAAVKIHAEESRATASACEVTVSEATTAATEEDTPPPPDAPKPAVLPGKILSVPKRGKKASNAVAKECVSSSAPSTSFVDTLPSSTAPPSNFNNFELEELPGFGDSSESSENEELFENIVNDLYLGGDGPECPKYLSSLEMDKCPWAAVARANLKNKNAAYASAYAALKARPSSNQGLTKSAVCGMYKSGMLHSTAVDHRLLTAPLLLPEARLVMLHATHTSTLHAAAAASPHPPGLILYRPEDLERVPVCGPGDVSDSINLISRTFDQLFVSLAQQSCCSSESVEAVVGLWMSLVLELCEDPHEKLKSSLVPQLPLSTTALSALLEALLNCGSTVSLKCWVSVLQLLTVCCNTSYTSPNGKPLLPLIEDPNLVPVLVLFLTSNFVNTDAPSSAGSPVLVGSSVSTLFHNLLVRLSICSDCFSRTSQSGNKLKALLLEVVARLLRQGCVSSSASVGAEDAQCILVRHLTKLPYAGFQEVPLMLEIVHKTASAVHSHLLHTSQSNRLSVTTSGSSSVGSNAGSSRVDLSSGAVTTTSIAATASSGAAGGGSAGTGGCTKDPGWKGLPNASYYSVTGRPSCERLLNSLLALVVLLLETQVAPQTNEAEEAGEESRHQNALHETPCNHSLSRSLALSPALLADTVVENRETVSLLFRSLGLCPDGCELLQRPMGTSASLALSLYSVLVSVNRILARPQLLLQPMLSYITCDAFERGWAAFSPLCLRVFCAVLDCEFMIRHFARMGGVKLLWTNLTESVSRACSPQSEHLGGLISSVMNQLSPTLPSCTVLQAKGKRTERTPCTVYHQNQNVLPFTVVSSSLPNASSYALGSSWNVQNMANIVIPPKPMASSVPYSNGSAPPAGNNTGVSSNPNLVNFAPLALVSSNQQSVRSPQSLVMPSHFLQRSKTSSWSHHFWYRNDTFIVLTLKLPCPILLHEIFLQPNTAPATHPSAVSVTAGVEGRCSAITGLIPTDTLSQIRLTLRSPVIASIVNIRLYKPKEYGTLGLVQIRLMGTTAFRSPLCDVPFVGHDSLRTQQDFSNCDWWLLLLRHCLNVEPSDGDEVLKIGVATKGSVRACVSLLLAPQFVSAASNSFDSCGWSSLITGAGSQGVNVSSPATDDSKLRAGHLDAQEPSEVGAAPHSACASGADTSGGDPNNVCSMHNEILAYCLSSGATLTDSSEPNTNGPKTSKSTTECKNSSTEVTKGAATAPPSAVKTLFSPGSSPLEQLVLGLTRRSPAWLEEFVATMLSHPRLADRKWGDRSCGLRLLYTACTSAGCTAGVDVVLYWLDTLLQRCSQAAASAPAELPVDPSVLYAAAAIIWSSKKHLQKRATDQLFMSVVIAACSCSADADVKAALDSVLCALCYVQPLHFTTLASVLADMHSKDKNDGLSVCGLQSSQLRSIVTAAHSSPAISLLLSSPLPLHTVCAVLEWCQRLVRSQLEWCKQRSSESSEPKFDISEEMTELSPHSAPEANQNKNNMLESHLNEDASSTKFTKVSGLQNSPGTNSSKPLGSIDVDCKVTRTSSSQETETSPNNEGPLRARASTPVKDSRKHESSSGSSSSTSRRNSSSLKAGVSVCNGEIETVAGIVRVLAELCGRPEVQQWLGRGPGALLWNTLLTVLGEPSLNSLGVDLSPLESATIELVKAACLNNQTNHRHLATHLRNLIARQKNVPAGGLCYVHSLSGFTRSLVVQVLLQYEQMVVEVEMSNGVTIVEEPPVEWLHSPTPRHPRHSLSLNSRLLSLPLSTTLAELISQLTGTEAIPSSSSPSASNSNSSEGAAWSRSHVQPPASSSGSVKEEPMVICYDDEDDDDDDDAVEEMMTTQMMAAELYALDKLSMAAAMNAKQKRTKDIVSAIVNGVISGIAGGPSKSSKGGKSKPEEQRSNASDSNGKSSNNAKSEGSSANELKPGPLFHCTVVASDLHEDEEDSDDNSPSLLKSEKEIEFEVPLHLTIAQVLASLEASLAIQDTHLKFKIYAAGDGKFKHSDYPETSSEAAVAHAPLHSKNGKSAAASNRGSGSAEASSRIEYSDTAHPIEQLPVVSECPSLLQEFCDQGGLAVLAHHMTVLYPDPATLQPNASHQTNKSSSGPHTPVGNNVPYPSNIMSNSHYASNSSACLQSNAQQSGTSATAIAPHTLGAFTLFLRLPGYAEELLTHPTEAKMLLKLALGVHDSCRESYRGEPVATVVYTRLNQVLQRHSVASRRGCELRRLCMEYGIVHHLLACLAALSAHTPPSLFSKLRHQLVPIPSVVGGVRAWCMDNYGYPSAGRPDGSGGGGTVGSAGVTGGAASESGGERCHYWAKGTGFGTGSTVQSWDVEQAIVRQRLQEEHIVWLLRLFHNFINPGDSLKKSDVDVQAGAAGCARSGEAESACSDAGKPSCSAEERGLTDEFEPLMAELRSLIHDVQFMDKVASHLSNDSVLDLSRHVPLYRALLAFIRSIAITPSLSPLLLHRATSAAPSSDSTSSILALLSRMSKTVNTYISKLSWKPSKTGKTSEKAATAGKGPFVFGGSGNSSKGSNSNAVGNASGTQNASNSSGDDAGVTNFVKTLIYMDEIDEVHKDYTRGSGTSSDDTDDEGLTLLVPDLQRTEILVRQALENLSESDPHATAAATEGEEQNNKEDSNKKSSIVEIYLETLKPLQFDSFEMVVEDESSGNIRFTVSHLYEGPLRNLSSLAAPWRIKRLAQEAVTLSTSLPLSYSSSVFIRTDTDRLDIMKVLIIGPEDTPYANGLFEFDVFFPSDYPTSPLQIKLQTTGEGRVRFNPNLYQDGKVCLSILNTWHGRPEEKWNSQTSSLLQVLVSIQSLILVSEPYFNEPGYERSRGTATATQHSREYDATIRSATVKWAILQQLKDPSPCFKEIVERHLYLKQHEIVAQIERWIQETETLPESGRRASRAAINVTSLKKLLVQLKEELAKLKAPPGLEDVELPTPAPIPAAQASASTSAPTTDPSVTKPRERKTSKANLMADLKWNAIDEELDEDVIAAAYDSNVPDGHAFSPNDLPAEASLGSLQFESGSSLNTIAAALNSTVKVFSSAVSSSSTSSSTHDSSSSSSSSSAASSSSSFVLTTSSSAFSSTSVPCTTSVSSTSVSTSSSSALVSPTLPTYMPEAEIEETI